MDGNKWTWPEKVKSDNNQLLAAKLSMLVDLGHREV